MSELKIKSNGLRNELKEIRKSIDKLTEAITLQQTYKRYEGNNNNGCNCGKCHCNNDTKVSEDLQCNRDTCKKQYDYD